MKTNQRNRSGNSKLKVLLALLLLLGGAALWWFPDARARIIGSDSRIKVFGTLPSRDLAEIRGLVRHEMWRDIIPRFSRSSVKALTWGIRSRLSERIVSIAVNADGTVEVMTCGEEKITGAFYGWTYQLKKGKGPKGWQIIGRGYGMGCT